MQFKYVKEQLRSVKLTWDGDDDDVLLRDNMMWRRQKNERYWRPAGHTQVIHRVIADHPRSNGLTLSFSGNSEEEEELGRKDGSAWLKRAV